MDRAGATRPYLPLAFASVALHGFVRRGGTVALTAPRRHNADAQQCDGSVLPGVAPLETHAA